MTASDLEVGVVAGQPSAKGLVARNGRHGNQAVSPQFGADPIRRKSMTWQQLLTSLGIALVLIGPVSFVIYQDLIRRYGKHLYDQPLGRGVSFQHYALDPAARKRARRGALVFFLVAAPL